MTTRNDRKGFTLVELLIVTVLGALLIVAIYQVLISNQRTYAAQNASIRGLQTLRGGMDVLFGELREISPQDGDIVAMAATGMRIRAARAPALLCGVVSTGALPIIDPIVRVKRLGEFLREDSARVFYANNPNITSDDRWGTAEIDVINAPATIPCPDGEVAATVILRGELYGSPPDSIHPGGLIRNIVYHEYRLGVYDGQTYLMREDEDGTFPLVGPLNPSNGVTFRYLDNTGTVTAIPTDVRQIEVTLRTESNIRSISGDLQQDSLKARVYTRN